ncbi:MAG: hypothetical protein DWQ01_08860 [Planctomycetota bacterium]|nr:MAG: hypothetical protein DWQ01_08860 [Planctomycetota bacterium]
MKTNRRKQLFLKALALAFLVSAPWLFGKVTALAKGPSKTNVGSEYLEASNGSPPSCGHRLRTGEPLPSLPRFRLPIEEFRTTTRLFSNELGLWWVKLIPHQKSLEVRILPDRWSFDLSRQTEGHFEPTAMAIGPTEEVFIAGRLPGLSSSAIYKLDFPWNGAPTYTTELLWMGPEIGDVLGLHYTKQINGGLTLFDFTHASLIYFHLADRTYRIVAEPSQYPALLEVFHLEINPIHRVENVFDIKEMTGISMMLQDSWWPVGPPYDPQIRTIEFVDHGGDGIDDFLDFNP